MHVYHKWAAFLSFFLSLSPSFLSFSLFLLPSSISFSLFLLPSCLSFSFSFQLSLQRSLYLSLFFFLACTRMLATYIYVWAAFCFFFFSLFLLPSTHECVQVLFNSFSILSLSPTPSAPSCLPPSILSLMLFFPSSYLSVSVATRLQKLEAPNFLQIPQAFEQG